MGSLRYIDYNNLSVLFIDFEGSLDDDDVLELGEKAKRLVKLSARNKLFLLYNLADVRFNRRLLTNISGLLANAHLVERRVLFGLDPIYLPVVEKLVMMMKMERNTKFTEDYTSGLNTLTDEQLWLPDRRLVSLPVAEDKRQPARAYTEEDFLDFGGGAGRLILLHELEPPED